MNRWLMTVAMMTALLAGCATGTTLPTGNLRPAINPQQVKLFTVPPAHYEIIGMVDAKTRGRHQAALDRATQELKKQAAKIGASGIILSGAPHQSSGGLLGIGNWTRLSGQAIVVTEPPK